MYQSEAALFYNEVMPSCNLILCVRYGEVSDFFISLEMMTQEMSWVPLCGKQIN